MPAGHLYVFFGEMSIKVFCPFFSWVFCCFFLMLSCISFFYILDIRPLLVISFANIFSHSIGCLFFLVMVSFAVQKLVSLIQSHLFSFVFISIALGGGSKRILLCCDLCHRMFCLCFPLRVL